MDTETLKWQYINEWDVAIRIDSQGEVWITGFSHPVLGWHRDHCDAWIGYLKEIGGGEATLNHLGAGDGASNLLFCVVLIDRAVGGKETAIVHITRCGFDNKTLFSLESDHFVDRESCVAIAGVYARVWRELESAVLRSR